MSSLEKKPKGGSIPHGVRHLTVTEKLVPGPGTYQAATTLAKIGGAFPKFQEQEEKLATPGSADYSPKINITKRKAQSTIVFKSDRVDFSKTITGPIGPGSYHLGQGSQGEMGKIGRSQRQDPHCPDPNVQIQSLSLASVTTPCLVSSVSCPLTTGRPARSTKAATQPTIKS